MIVEAANLSFRYSSSKRRGSRKPASSEAAPATDAAALDRLSFRIEEAGRVALLGPNGSGKSTLFRILTTMLAPGGGWAKVCGADTVRQAAEVRKQIGVVFQESSLDRKLTVRENLHYQGLLFGLTGAALRDRMLAAAKRLGLEDRMDSFVETLSGGLKRRVEIAKALLHRPRLLLLDEPSTGLDPNARRELWDWLAELHRTEGTAVVAATHYLDEAESCHRVLILHEGKLVRDGDPAALKREVSGDVIIVETSAPKELEASIRNVTAATISALNGSLRIECPNGPAMIADLMNQHAENVKELRMHKPSLDDVFFRATGRSFPG